MQQLIKEHYYVMEIDNNIELILSIYYNRKGEVKRDYLVYKRGQICILITENHEEKKVLKKHLQVINQGNYKGKYYFIYNNIL